MSITSIFYFSLFVKFKSVVLLKIVAIGISIKEMRVKSQKDTSPFWQHKLFKLRFPSENPYECKVLKCFMVFIPIIRASFSLALI